MAIAFLASIDKRRKGWRYFKANWGKYVWKRCIDKITTKDAKEWV